jgi:two-component system, NarL family, nitrate/nitrite response regulator NarL
LARRLEVVLGCSYGLYCAGLKALLETASDIAVLGTSGSASIALDLARGAGAHVLLLDVDLSGLGAADFLLPSREEADQPRVILLATPADQRAVIEALRRGAWGMVLKDASPELLFRSIRVAAAGEAWVDRDLVSRLLETIHLRSAPTRTNGVVLTPRELDVLREVVAGGTNADIARTLGLRPQTVKDYLTALFDKAGVSSRLELALHALHHRLVDPR